MAPGGVLSANSVGRPQKASSCEGFFFTFTSFFAPVTCFYIFQLQWHHGYFRGKAPDF